MDNMKTDNKPVCIENWHEVNWKWVNQTVVKLRRRIFNARKNNEFRSLRNLQRLMLASSANILFSIRKVSYNSGKSTPGIDGITLKSPSERLDLFNEISRNKWNGLSPKPIRRIYIKEINKLRPIGIPTIYDRVIQVMLCNSLEPEWEAIFEIGSYGFRPKRNVNDAVSRIWLSLNKETSRKWIVDTDISKCFDSISHDYLLKTLSYFPGVSLIKEMLEVGIIVRDVWMASDLEGTPQGSAISPLLCNIALHGLEKELGVRYTKKGYVMSKYRSLIRFADDLVILCHTKSDAELAPDTLKTSLSNRGLEISEVKTKIVHITQGFDFLGFHFKMQPKPYISKFNAISVNDIGEFNIVYKNVGVYVTPSRKSITKVKMKLKEAMRESFGKSALDFINKANPIIRGYAQAKIHWHSNKVFRELDKYLFILSWRWAIRKHPQKGSHWIKKRYFKRIRLGYIRSNWVFSAFDHNIVNPVLYSNSYLLKFRWFPIRDYLVAQMDRLSDNKEDAPYFKDLEYRRLLSRGFNIFRKLDKYLILSQEGLCPICDDSLFNGEKLHLHHIVPTSKGGKTTFKNLVYLHMPCHYSIHNKKDSDDIISLLEGYKESHPRPNLKKQRIEESFEDIP